jgi:hypothetical protein
MGLDWIVAAQSVPGGVAAGGTEAFVQVLLIHRRMLN